MVSMVSSTALLRIRSATASPTNVSSRGNRSSEATSPAVTLTATMTWLRESTDWVMSANCPLRSPT